MMFTQTNFETVLRSLGPLLPNPGHWKTCPTIPCGDEALRFGSFEVVGDPPVSRLSGQRAVIVVIESPHVDEFDQISGRWQAVGPLQKRAPFVDHFQSNIGSHTPVFCGNDLVILMNAVQYQCSLGLPLQGHRQNAIQRDRIFKACWSHGANIDFTKRLAAVYRAGDVIVNACTGTMFNVRKRQTGHISNDLKWLVETAIMAALPHHRHPGVYPCRKTKRNRLCISDVGTHHPSVWRGLDREVMWPDGTENHALATGTSSIRVV